MRIDHRKTFEWGFSLLVAVTLTTGLYLLLLTVSPALPNWSVLGFHEVDIKTIMEGTKPGERGNRLYIEKLGLDLPIPTNNDATALEQGAWHRQPQRGNPEKGGNFILSGHRFSMGYTPQQTRAKSPFYHIETLQPGDELFVDFNGKRYAYEVMRLYDVPKTATEIESPSETAKLTLYSCDLRGAQAGRLVVEAKPLGPL